MQFHGWVGTLWRCSNKSVSWEIQILCYILVWSRYWPQSGTGVGEGAVPKEALLRNKVVKSGSHISNSFLSNLLMLSAPVDSIWRHLNALSLACTPAQLDVDHSLDEPFNLGASPGREGMGSTRHQGTILAGSWCFSSPWFLFLFISISKLSHCPCEKRKNVKQHPSTYEL